MLAVAVHVGRALSSAGADGAMDAGHDAGRPDGDGVVTAPELVSAGGVVAWPGPVAVVQAKARRATTIVAATRKSE
jgi:hypothetical protein